MKVGAFTAACLLVSNAVGSGIFTTTGFMARDLGDPLVILGLWALGGALALAGAMSYGELGAALPEVGGEYVYLRRAFGPLFGFLSGWTSFTMGFGAAIAAAAAGFAAYLGELAPGRLHPTAAALLLIWSLTAVHLLGVERGGRLQRGLTALKIGGIVLVFGIALAVGSGSWSHVVPDPEIRPRIGSAFVALVFVMYAFSGWNAAGYIAGELRDPGRDLPRATIAGTAFIALLYLAVNVVYFYALPPAELAAEPVLPVAQKAAAALLGPGAATLVSALLCASIAGSVSAMVWAGPRVYCAMARDGVAPASLARTTRAGAPARSILLQSLWSSLLLVSGTFEQLVVYSGVALALWSGLAVSSLIVLRAREPGLARPYRVAPYPWVPLTYIAAAGLIVLYGGLERPLEAGLAAVTLLAGLPFYAWWRRASPRRQPLRL